MPAEVDLGGAVCFVQKPLDTKEMCALIEARMEEQPETRLFVFEEKDQVRLFVPRLHRDKVDLLEMFPCFKGKAPIGAKALASQYLLVVSQYCWEHKLEPVVASSFISVK